MDSASAPAAPEEPVSQPRNFAPVHSCGGLIAAVGVLLFAAVGLVTTLPGFPVALAYPTWLLWALRLAPVPVLLLVWAVVHEAEFKVRTDASAIHFRQPLGRGLRVPWREVTDFFADCGRGPEQIVASGGSLVDDRGDSGVPHGSAPFASRGPDYTIVSARGTFVFDDSLADVSVLADGVVRHAPAWTPEAWEEASWLTCRRCDERVAVSFWPLPTDHLVRYCDRCRAPAVVPADALPSVACACGGEFVREDFTCPACEEPYGQAFPPSESGFIVERRGAVRPPRSWSASSMPRAEGGGEDEPNREPW